MLWGRQSGRARFYVFDRPLGLIRGAGSEQARGGKHGGLGKIHLQRESSEQLYNFRFTYLAYLGTRVKTRQTNLC